MGCLPGNHVELVQVAPFSDPMYLNINGTHLAIRKETAIHILIEYSMSKQINVALIGNPNTGKTSVFNALTGLKSKSRKLSWYYS